MPFSRLYVVASAPTSEPAPGSVQAEFQICSPVPSVDSTASICSSVPSRMTVSKPGSW